MALSDEGNLQLKQKRFRGDLRPLEAGCACSTCRHFSRAYLHALAAKEQTGARLVTIHNIAYMMRLGARMRAAIKEDRFPSFVADFFAAWFPRGDYPSWCIDALAAVGITLPAPAPAPASAPAPAALTGAARAPGEGARVK